MEFLTPETMNEFENYMMTHPNGSFMQSTKWAIVKHTWDSAGVISRDADGKIKGAVHIIYQTVPVFGTRFMYAPRGPICDFSDRETLADLTDGIRQLGEKLNAHSFKCDPDFLASDEEYIEMFRALGYEYFKGGLNFETIQPRFNYRLFLNGRNEEQLFANLTQKTRYNCRLAMKKGVEIRVCGKEMLDEFVRLMSVTGERDGFNVRPKWYFEKFLDAHGENVRLYMAFYEGKAVSGAITTRYAGKTCYVYGASDNANRNVMPNYLIQWEMIKWAIEGGCSVYDFQGVSGDLSEDNPLYGLYRFKRGFNGDLVELAGEFEIVFKPVVNKAVNAASGVREKVVKLKSGH